MRMLDRILRHGFYDLDDGQILESINMASLGAAFDASVCVDVANVLDYVRATRKSGEDWFNIVPKNMPLVPPWSTCFMETGVVPTKTKTTPPVRIHVRGGALLSTYEISQDELSSTLQGLSTLDRDGHFAAPLRDPVRWAVAMMFFYEAGGRVYGPISRGAVWLTPDGMWAKCHDGVRAMWLMHPTQPTPYQLSGDGGVPVWVDHEHMMIGLSSAFQSCWMTACAFANCVNVAIVDEEPRYASRQERRASERRGDPPLVKFKTLRIDPNRQRHVTEDERKANDSGHDLPLHIVRGHFATYTEDKPLFGKYAGRFYIPAHVRGSAEVGIVGKDYRVLPGEPS